MNCMTEKKYKIKQAKDTLCWDCKNALLGCSWAKDFEPVKGWKARKTPKTITKPSSYKVYKCPEFMPDEKGE